METTLTASSELLAEPEIRWVPWIVTFLSGFITGATTDLLALWLLAQWFHRH
jgi:hypothetical protein